MSEATKQSCHICGEPATRVYRGYPLCQHCDRLLDEMLSIMDNE